MSDYVLNAMAQHLEPYVYDEVYSSLMAGGHPQSVADAIEPQIRRICERYYHRSFSTESLSDVMVRAALEENRAPRIASAIVANICRHHGWDPSWMEVDYAD